MNHNNRLLKTAIIYALISVFCLIFSQVYEYFSYGEYSIYMRKMFLIPLFGGLFPSLIILNCHVSKCITRPCFNLWNSGIAVLVFGCLIRGIIQISGRTTSYDRYYFIIGTFFIITGMIYNILKIKKA